MQVRLPANPFRRFRPFNRRSTDHARFARELAWSALPWPAQIYVAAVILAGTWMVAVLFPRTYPQLDLFLILLASTYLPSLGKVNLPIPKRSGSTLSVSYAANL